MAQCSQAAWRVQEVGELPGFKHGFDLGNEGRDCLPPFTIRFGDLQEVQELLADQVAHRLVSTVILLNATGCFAPICDDLAGSLGLPIRFLFAYRDLHCHSIGEVQAASQMILGHKFELRGHVGINDPKHPACPRLARGDHLEFGPPYLGKSSRWVVGVGFHGVPGDQSLRNRQRRSELSFIQLFKPVAFTNLVKSFREAVDLYVQESWRKLPRPVFRFQEQVISPRNDYFLRPLVGLQRPDEFKLSHWLVSLLLADYRWSAIRSWPLLRPSFSCISSTNSGRSRSGRITLVRSESN